MNKYNEMCCLSNQFNDYILVSSIKMNITTIYLTPNVQHPTRQ